MSDWRWPGLKLHGPPLPTLDGVDVVACTVGLRLELADTPAAPVPFDLPIPLESSDYWWTQTRNWLLPTESGWQGSFTDLRAGGVVHEDEVACLLQRREQGADGVHGEGDMPG